MPCHTKCHTKTLHRLGCVSLVIGHYTDERKERKVMHDGKKNTKRPLKKHIAKIRLKKEQKKNKKN